MKIPDELIQDIKNYLDITFSDTALDSKIAGIIQRGASYISNVAGCELEFAKENLEKQLLFDYCRYATANNLEDFEHNFSQELITLRTSKEVEDYAAREV